MRIRLNNGRSLPDDPPLRLGDLVIQPDPTENDAPTLYYTIEDGLIRCRVPLSDVLAIHVGGEWISFNMGEGA